jgi:tetratricopeptide (TPR) repeat protein
MTFSAFLLRCALAVLLCVSLSGCTPAGQSPIDDEKEPHFIEGKRAVNSFDFKGAIEEFEKAVEANPHNASAHFELGWLYEEKEPDPAAAIYHYEQFLKLRPNADTGEAVRQRITNCKQDLAKAVLPLPTTPGVQRDLEQLIEENKQLRAEVDRLQAEVRAQQTNHSGAIAGPAPQGTIQQTGTGQTVPTNIVFSQTGGGNHGPPSHPGPGRTYVVQNGDTMAAISRKFNVKLDALAAANPGVDARRLRVGQTVNIP